MPKGLNEKSSILGSEKLTFQLIKIINMRKKTRGRSRDREKKHKEIRMKKHKENKIEDGWDWRGQAIAIQVSPISSHIKARRANIY